MDQIDGRSARLLQISTLGYHRSATISYCGWRQRTKRGALAACRRSHPHIYLPYSASHLVDHIEWSCWWTKRTVAAKQHIRVSYE